MSYDVDVPKGRNICYQHLNCPAGNTLLLNVPECVDQSEPLSGLLKRFTPTEHNNEEQKAQVLIASPFTFADALVISASTATA